MTSMSFSQIPSYVPINGLVGYYPFNNNANDESSNSNHGSVSGATLTEDRFGFSGQAYDFNGGIQYIKTLEQLNITGVAPRTISLWFNVTSFDDGWKTLLNFGEPCPNFQTSFTLQVDSALNPNKETRVIIKTNGFDDDDYYFQISKQKWYHYVATFASDTSRIYIDGVFTGFRPISINTTLTRLWIGFDSTSLLCPEFDRQFNQPFNGKIDDIGIWNRALTSEEINILYTSNDVTSTSERNNLSVEVYPNPVKDELTIRADNELIGQTFKLFDLYGNQIVFGYLTPFTKIEKLDIAKGVYFLVIGENITKRIVVF